MLERATSRWTQIQLNRLSVLLILAACFPFQMRAADVTRHAMIPKWSRFEAAFQSQSRGDSPEETSIAAEFVSPSGTTNLVPGFRDGRNIWRIRFQPDQPGRWEYRTICSNPNNRRLHHQRGQFLCTAIEPGSRFAKHGPVKRVRNQAYFQHQDGTPFFWIADLASNGVRMSSDKDWRYYCEARIRQGFNAVQWRLSAKPDAQNETPLMNGTPNLRFFQRADRRIEAMDQAGLLSVIELTDTDHAEGEPTALKEITRHAVARWSANNVAWLLSPNTVDAEKTVRFLNDLSECFSDSDRFLVLLAFPERARKINLADFPWIDGISTTASSLENLRALIATNIPVIAATRQLENSIVNGVRIDDSTIRNEVWPRLLRLRAAGYTYGAAGVRDWDASLENSADLPLWQKSIFLPGAKQQAFVSHLYAELPYWKLKPLAPASSRSESTSFNVAAQTDDRKLTLIYTPRGPFVEFPLRAFPDLPELTWFNPRTGQSRSGVAAIGPRTAKFPTPDSQDWLLIVRDRKPK